jgi:hypothetical protein
VSWLLAICAALPPLVVPGGGAPWAPAELRIAGPRLVPPASLEDATNCGSCHADIAAQWRTSAHALASFTNPLYRVSVERLRAERGAAPSRMCASCHDLALLAAGAMDEAEIAPDDPRAHAGVSCTTCHSAAHATRDGNGSLTLRSDLALPSAPEDSTLAAHRRRVVSVALRTAELCGACHRAFLDEQTGNAAALLGMDDYGAWQRSAWAGSTGERPDHVKARDCRGCHMPREAASLGDVAAKDGTVPSHRFLGAHTTLAAMRGDAAQLVRQQEFLKGTARVDVAAARVDGGPWAMPAERAVARAGVRLEVDVVIFNARVGHRFPGGVLDNQGARLELTLRTTQGRVVASSSEHEVRAQVVSVDGRPLLQRQTHEFVATAWNHTVPARDARVARIRLQVPADLPAQAFPLSVEARLVHQARSPALMQAACDDAHTPRGKAFRREGLRLTLSDLDACVAQPETPIDTQVVLLDGTVRDETWVRAYRRGLGLSAGLQEYLDEAEEAFAHAAGLAQGRDLGTAHWALGSLAGKRGQVDRALSFLQHAQEELGPLASIAKARGETYAQVWRWSEAAAAFREALVLAPDDLLLWQSLAMAEASVGRPLQALAAAQAGLRLHPRDGDCLRVQALAFERLGAPTSAALDAALHWRVPDDGPAAKARCGARVPGCSARRNPVPVYEAQAP